ncbi:MAG: TolC family protein [Candidatus Obscuribacterales bacterium]|jgi:outer membrane protein TolC|nr:TolC family protein [Candidatus Obscuribacterales bacterium]
MMLVYVKNDRSVRRSVVVGVMSGVLPLVAGLVSPVVAQAAVQSVDTGKNSQAKINGDATTESAKPLRTHLPSMQDKHPAVYVKQFESSQTPKALGSHPVEKAEIPLERIQLDQPSNEGTASGERTSAVDHTPVPIKRPPLSALISVQQNLNPFTLDANLVEKINLTDALDQAMSNNLEIEANFATLKAQQYAVLSQASRFLPDINSGYQLIGITGRLPGALVGGNTGAFTLPHTVQVLNTGFRQSVYQGGSVVFGTLREKHRYRADKAALKSSINDVLLDTSKRYYDLLYNEALLEIRTRAVEISEEQVRLNQAQERAGTATGLDVLQSQAQLASDQQNLVDQQSTRRQSALKLASLINSSLAQDLVSAETELKRRRLIPRRTPIESLLRVALDNRPELRQYEELRLAARRAIVVAQAPLHPQVNVNGNIYGIGANGSGLDALYNIALQINWQLGKLGLQDAANIAQAKWQAREAAVRAKTEFKNVFEQVRTTFDQSLAADKRIDHASAQIAAAEEELRIATKRMQAGIGLNIDVLNAQRDRTQAYINKARAMVDFNVAQAQLVRDIGVISVGALSKGVTP